MNQPVKGFSLVELLVVIAVLGVIGAIAIPSYFNYARKAYYTQVVKATGVYKTAIEACYHKTKNLKACSTPGKNGIPKNPQKSVESVLTIALSKAGVIRVTPIPKAGVTAKDTYVLTPKVSNKQLTWQVSGGAVKHGLALPG